MQYVSRLKPFWLSSVACNDDSGLQDCSKSFLIGYSQFCSLTSSIFDSAEVNCGKSVQLKSIAIESLNIVNP